LVSFAAALFGAVLGFVRGGLDRERGLACVDLGARANRRDLGSRGAAHGVGFGSRGATITFLLRAPGTEGETTCEQQRDRSRDKGNHLYIGLESNQLKPNRIFFAFYPRPS
jgi:hypothetical protein